MNNYEIACGTALEFELLISWSEGETTDAFTIDIPVACTPCWICSLGLPARITDLKLTGVDPDLVFHWSADPRAGGGYNLYQTDEASHVSEMRLDNPDYAPFQRAAPPDTTTTFSNGMNDGQTFYQILGVCEDDLTEGPN
jgi:hypothetical protein